MSVWSVYVSPEDEKLLKKKIEKIAEKRHWSFSQAVSGLLREHLLEENKLLSDDESWSLMSAKAFFDGYSEKDSVYDQL
ncbi:MAG TPA: hypothetical protein DDW49_10305 [Deltaproteobacteria bacterium]|nr:MAG: hypothetical protein A2048_08105 [Deltaproteobacteria bacterium GWA2_45_12]HBF13754.1 hypothetical protein [Deltaproteobacteria bacterium]